MAEGKPEAAKPVFKECLALRRKTLPENHWLLATTNNFLGDSV